MTHYIPLRSWRAATHPLLLPSLSLFLLAAIFTAGQTNQQDLVKAELYHVELYHKLGSDQQEFKQRGSILLRTRTDNIPAQATILHQDELSSSDLDNLKLASNKGDTYHLRAEINKKKGGDTKSPLKVAQTIINACSLYTSNLADKVVINLSPHNEFISVNLVTENPECNGPPPQELAGKFNTTVSIEVSPIGPQPDTTTYIKRIEEERQNKLKEGKEDNRSFFAKYWIYIVPAVIILMMLGGPDQGQGR